MVDRSIVYPAALPQDTDILNTNKFHMYGLGYLAHGVLGTSTVVEGLACLPTSPTPDLNVHVQVGSIYSLVTADASAYGSLGTDATQIVKQGINNTIQNLAITPPGTSGFSQVYLVQAEYSDVDAGSQVLSYFNAANPAVPYSGPANSGSSQFTTRTGVCTIGLVAGVAATTGTQTTPSPTAGFTGLYAITVANGQTQITSSNIVQLTTAPFFPTLPAVPADVQNEAWTYAVDTSAGGAAIATNATTSTSSAVLNFAASAVPAWVANGMKVFDLTTVGAITGGQTILSHTTSSITLTANVNATVGSGDLIAIGTNAMVASISPTPASLVAGLTCAVKVAGTNSGAVTLNLNGLGAVNVHRSTGANLSPGDLTSGMVADFVYDGSAWQVCNFNGSSGGGSGSTTVVSIPYGVDTSGTVNQITVNPTPTVSSYAAGLTIEVKIANTTSGATQINVNSLGNVAVKDRFLNALGQASLVAGQVALLIHDGTQFQVANSTIPYLTGPTTFYVNNSTGSDSNNGLTTGTAWFSISHAIAAISTYTLNGNTVTLQLANTGINYTAPPTFNAPVSGAFIIQGNLGAQGSYVISGSGSNGVIQVGAGDLVLQGLTIQNTGTNAANLYVSPGTVSCQNVTFATTTSAFNQGSVVAGPGSQISLLSGNIYQADAQAALIASGGGQIIIEGNGQTNGSPTYVQGFAVAELCGVIQITAGWTWSGSGAFGPRYAAALNGVIDTIGSGANYFPGSLPGFVSTGGQYV